MEQCDDIRISVATDDRREGFSDRQVLLRKISGGLWPPPISCVVFYEDFLSENFFGVARARREPITFPVLIEPACSPIENGIA